METNPDIEQHLINESMSPSNHSGLKRALSRIDFHRDSTENSPNSPNLSPYTQYLESSSDYTTYPADLQLSIKRAGQHRIRDYSKFPPKGHLSLFESKEEIKKHSTTAFFYFDFLEEGVYILMITFIITGIFEIITIITYPYIKLNPDTTTPFFYLSSLSVNYPNWVIIFKLTLAVINLLAVKVYSGFKENARIRRYLEENHVSQNYFSVFVQGLPHVLDLNKFYDFMDPHLEGESRAKIKKMIFLQDNTDKRSLMNRRRTTYVKSLKNKNEGKDVAEFSIELQKLDEEINGEDDKLSNNQRFNGSMIMILEDSFTTMELLQKWSTWTFPQRMKAKFFKDLLHQEYLKEFEFEGKHVHVEKVGEPFDVDWSNSGKSQSDVFFRSLIASVFTWGVVLIYPLVKIKFVDTEKPNIEVMATGLFSALWYFTPYITSIILVNLCIILVINFLSMFSGLRRKSDVEKRKIEMKVVFNFVSYGFLIAAKAFIDSMEFRNSNHHDSGFRKDILKAKESLTSLIPTLMLYFIFLPQFLEVFDFEFLFKWLRMKYYLSGNRISRLSQGELDEVMKPVYFDFSTRVSNVGQIVFMSLATAPIFPLSPILGMMALGAASFTDRYLVLRRSSDWKLVGSNLGISFSKAYNYNFIVQILGVLLFLLFDNQTSESTSAQVVMILIVVIALASLFSLYFSPAVKKHAFKDLEMDNMEYDEEKSKFKITYEQLYEDFLMNAR